MDGKGLRFHASAFIIAELRGQIPGHFLESLIYGSYLAEDFVGLLTPQQRAAIVACIRFYGDIEHYACDLSDIDRAVARFHEVN